MIPVLYSALEKTFNSNGLGGLPDAISCVVTEQRNTPGGYWLEMEYPIDGLHYADIAPDRIIYAAPSMGNRPQPFRISRITRPINGIVHIEAPHVSNQLQKITTFRSFTRVKSAVGAFGDYKKAATDSGQAVPFYITSDIEYSDYKNVAFPQPTPFADVIVGKEGSIVDVFGGELEFDGWNVKLNRSRGVDTGIEIRYGVNMSDIVAETDSGELVTAVMPYWVGDVNGTETTVVGDLCASDNVNAFSYMRTVPLDVSSQFEGSETPKKAQVTSAGMSFINKTELKEVSMSTMVKYTPTTLGIGDRRINLCDTVRVVHPDLKVSSTAKVVETRFNVLTGQYESITIGSIRKSIVDTIADIIKK